MQGRLRGPSNKVAFFFYIHLLFCMCMGGHSHHGMCVLVRRREQVSSLSLCGSWRSNSSCEAWWQVSLPISPASTLRFKKCYYRTIKLIHSQAGYGYHFTDRKLRPRDETRAGETAQRLRSPAALPEYPGSIPSTHTGQIKGNLALVTFPQTPTQTCIYTHTSTCN